MARKQKITKNEKLTLIIASFALLLTLLQLLFSIPFISDAFYSAEVIGKRLGDKCTNGRYESTFLISNTGNKKADNLIANLTIPANSTITIVPNIFFETETRKNGEPLKDLIIKCQHFLPKENIYIIVNTDSTGYHEFKIENEVLKIPMLGLIKFDEGFGKTEKQ